ncbi:hypothetical protein TBR22_A12940 [Luteitalea sp. TBR-22]|nr:hypothetical protein TBR22_A12940 [Luteitalea sp. TBR-22]
MQLTTDRGHATRLIQRVRGQKGTMPQFERQECHDSTVLLTVINRAARVMRGNPAERRSILVISEGRKIFMSDPGAGRVEACHEVRAEYDKLVAVMADTNVSIYGIDPRGLEAPFPDMSGASPGQAAAMAGREAQARVDQMSSRYYGALGLMASSTGGTLTTDRNDLTAGVATMVGDSRRYYRLAYRQPDVAADKTPRSVQVKVTRPGVDVRSRRYYVPR